jgi:hypothetical protein
MNWAQTLVNDYFTWLKDKTIVKQDELTDWTAIDTPFVNMFNDTIEIYAQKKNNKVILSDDGETLSNLEMAGVNIAKSTSRKDFLTHILRNYGIKLQDEELVVECDPKNFPQNKFNMLSAIIEINDMYMLSKQNVASVFKEDIKNFLDQHEIIYTPDFISKGESGLEFTFDFQMMGRKEEVVMKSFNKLDKNLLSTFLFSWQEIEPIRKDITGKEVKAIAFINDVDKKINTKYLDALKSKGAEVILWSKREEEVGRLRVA